MLLFKILFYFFVFFVLLQESEDAMNRGVYYMLEAAHLGDRQAMVYMAKAYETGSGLGSFRYIFASQVSSKVYCLSVDKFLIKI